jgi:hypothetical protein
MSATGADDPILARLMAAGAGRVLCARSRAGYEPVPEDGLFFYHVPKSAGVTFFTALRYAITLGRPAGPTLAECFRFDEALPSAFHLERNYRLVASHLPYGVHDRFRHPRLLTTLVREPVGRVRSAYTYDCMRRGEPVSAAGFEAVLRSEEALNRTVKQLTGLAPEQPLADPAQWKRAVDTLIGNFHSYVGTDRVAGLIEAYLSLYRLPNVAMPPLNTTRPEFRLDETSHAAEILERNRQDQALFEYVRDHPRLPDPPAAGAGLHAATVVITENDSTTRTEGRARCFPTAEIQTRTGLFNDPASPPAGQRPGRRRGDGSRRQTDPGRTPRPEPR